MITQTQTQPNPSNRNPITASDVALKAASERYQNAVKGITNLLAVIDQARANKNKAKNDLDTYTAAFNNAVSRQRNAQETIVGFELRITQIKSAIAGAQDKLNDVNDQINDLNNQKRASEARRI